MHDLTPNRGPSSSQLVFEASTERCRALFHLIKVERQNWSTTSKVHDYYQVKVSLGHDSYLQAEMSEAGQDA